MISPFAPNALIAVGGIRRAKLAREADENDRSFFGKLRESDQNQVSRIIEELIEKNGLATKMILKNHWINKSEVVRVPGKARTLSHLAS